MRRYLRRYRNFYTQKMGYTVVSFMMPSHLAVMPHTAAAKRLLHEVVDGIAKLRRGSGGGRWKLYFHTFSNTGWFCYGGMVDFMKHHCPAELFQSISVVIVDSAFMPKACPKVWAFGIMGAMMPHRRGGGATSVSDGGSTPLRERLQDPLERFLARYLSGPSGKKLMHLATVLEKHQTYPQFYVYSLADEVIPADAIEDFMQTQRLRGRMVRSLRFTLSPHVDHFRKHNKVYVSQLKSFIAECAEWHQSGGQEEPPRLGLAQPRQHDRVAGISSPQETLRDPLRPGGRRRGVGEGRGRGTRNDTPVRAMSTVPKYLGSFSMIIK